MGQTRVWTWRDHAAIALVIFVLTAALITLTWPWVSWGAILNNQGLAAWVQAVGSIAAVFGAVFVARYQYALQARSEARAAVARKIELLAILRRALDAGSYLQNLEHHTQLETFRAHWIAAYDLLDPPGLQAALDLVMFAPGMPDDLWPPVTRVKATLGDLVASRRLVDEACEVDCTVHERRSCFASAHFLHQAMNIASASVNSTIAKLEFELASLQ